MSKPWMQLELSQSSKSDAFNATMGATYRDEGLSVGTDHMRLYGEIIQFQVFFSDLIMGKRIGQGACSSVNLATHKKTGEIFAVKMFNIYDQGQAAQLHKEILLLTKVECDAVITLKGAFHDEGAIGIIMEYMDRGSLEFITRKDVTMTESVMAAITFQIIWGLGYLHYENQIHRDVKPANILMNSQGQVKLSDFGISKELDGSAAMLKSAVGSYRYMSPERLLSEKYDASGDIWSVGITIVQLWNKAYPFDNVSDTPIDLLSQLESPDCIGHLISPLPKNMREVVLSMLENHPARRKCCTDIANSPWFESHGINSLTDAHTIVARWIKTLDSKILHQTRYERNIERAPQKDPYAMSISIDSSSNAGVHSKYDHKNFGDCNETDGENYDDEFDGADEKNNYHK